VQDWWISLAVAEVAPVLRTAPDSAAAEPAKNVLRFMSDFGSVPDATFGDWSA
jgi:hypothetical protein